jgi:hypothetical protein
MLVYCDLMYQELLMWVWCFLFFNFFQFCDVGTLVIIHKESLAMFGYRLTFKVKFD